MIEYENRKRGIHVAYCHSGQTSLVGPKELPFVHFCLVVHHPHSGLVLHSLQFAKDEQFVMGPEIYIRFEIRRKGKKKG